MHVVIATDGSPTALAAAREAAGLFAPERVTVLTVLTSLPGENVDELEEPEWSPEEESRQWEIVIRDANRELERTAAVVSAPHLEPRVEAGDVASTISRVAAEVDADLIVLGASMRHGLRHLLHRSIAERVVRDAPCSVLVVRERQTTA